jgi:hypothetical protein
MKLKIYGKLNLYTLKKFNHLKIRIMGAIEIFLAQLFAKFKTESPTLAAVVLGLLAGFVVFLQNSDVFGETTSTILFWVTFVLAAITGAHTTKLLEKEGPKK